MTGKVLQALRESIFKSASKSFKKNQYGKKHNKAMFGGAFFGTILEELARYADAHAARLESPLGGDYVLGDYWLDTVKALLSLRDGELGDLDAGLLGEHARDMARAAEFTEKEIESIP